MKLLESPKKKISILNAKRMEIIEGYGYGLLGFYDKKYPWDSTYKYDDDSFVYRKKVAIGAYKINLTVSKFTNFSYGYTKKHEFLNLELQQSTKKKKELADIKMVFVCGMISLEVFRKLIKSFDLNKFPKISTSFTRLLDIKDSEKYFLFNSHNGGRLDYYTTRDGYAGVCLK